jgi:trans-2,3-dihydro-3-hydroxyanthranilate isomerase
MGRHCNGRFVKTYPFVTVDVFTSKRFGGNPLAVITDARGLSDDDMQALAREFNISETAFVLPPDDAANTARVRIFTPAYELPFAGHPNVGTGFVLARQGRDRQGVLRFEEIAGLVEVTVERNPQGEPTGATIAAPQALKLGLELAPATAAACAGLQPDEVITAHHPPVQASLGTGVVIAEVAADALSRASPDLDQFRRAEAQWPDPRGILLYIYARDAGRTNMIRARLFAPMAGIIEDPATGGAATPLAALLVSLSDDETASYDIAQGVEMGRPSLLRTTAARTPDGIRATVGGDCVPVLSGEAMV